MTFRDFFKAATTFEPYPYQERLSRLHADALLVETGLGKTEAVALAWDWKRRADCSEPRRLIYVLPMRSLVEQTASRLEKCFSRLREAGLANVPGIDVAMGGDVGESWFQEPEKPWVVIGTQDMLLSRALNRGYGMSRFLWPMTFGAINNDVHWVIDEVQLQGIGAVTAAQLQAFRERLGAFGHTRLTLMSATLDQNWFETADFTLRSRTTVSLDSEDYKSASVQRVVRAGKTIERCEAYQPETVAELASNRHANGTRTLVVLNTVERAQEVYRRLQRLRPEARLVLLHSRYRPHDRAAHALELVQEPADAGVIAVATQVVEAGIDVSAATLITDVAPWSSLVQRFGRCNRRGAIADARCLWLDGGDITEKNARPYDAEDIRLARAALLSLEGRSAAPCDLPKQPIPLREGLVLRKPELLDLFDTSSDLAGHDVDVSAFIRPDDDISGSLLWRDEPPSADDPPQREELCSVTLHGLRELVRNVRSSGHGSDIRVANQFASPDGPTWTPLTEALIRPGIVVWVRGDIGWYDADLGFYKISQHVSPITHELPHGFHEECVSNDGDAGTAIGVAVPLTKHALDTRDEALRLTSSLPFIDDAQPVIEAALWHDVGKAHPVFQETMRAGNEGLASDVLWAKSERPTRHKQRGFRHELPGALVYLAAHDGEVNADLVAYLIAAHHGKLRVATQPKRYEADADELQLLGNRNGDIVPPVRLDGVVTPETTISLEPFRVGTNGARAWVDRTVWLRDSHEFGPFRLAFLELIVRISDWRASRKEAGAAR